MDDLKKHITKLREDFTKGPLTELDVNALPHLQFEHWLKQAVDAQVPEVQAMTLSTVSEDNKPSGRIVYLREFENNSFWFYGNYESRKGKHLAANTNAALTFFWPQLERQIRIEGEVEICDAMHSDNYFNARPLESQIGAWASAQSSKLASRQELEDKLALYKKEFENKTVVRPPSWGGWVLKANYYEFWQGRKSRLHDRIVYEPAGNLWKIKRLSP
ncbi:MAG: pyridoxamine 5'-phosphate oxidase [Bacteroidia bacterium]|nr:pyridoxamine 5'-phosphate oxidase [Bacteroidia bacterium]